MNTLQRIDARLVASAYQAVVDWSQRKAEWWVEHAAIAFSVSMLAEAGVRGWFTQPGHLCLVVVMAVWAAVVLLSARIAPEALQLLLSPEWVRRACFATTVLSDVLKAVTSPEPLLVLTVANDIAFLSVWYFAACEPPRPRKRTEPKLVPAGSGA
jgi:hypothetical protein